MTQLFEMMRTVQSTNPYFQKDLQKARNATKFIGLGSLASSTNKYMQAAAHLANCGNYTSDDVIFVSAEGARRGRVPAPLGEIQKAVDAKSTFVTDDAYNRERSYNVGEREVSSFLESKGYRDTGKGVWKPR